MELLIVLLISILIGLMAQTFGADSRDYDTTAQRASI